MGLLDDDVREVRLHGFQRVEQPLAREKAAGEGVPLVAGELEVVEVVRVGLPVMQLWWRNLGFVDGLPATA